MFDFVRNNPYLFIGSSTVMTTTLTLFGFALTSTAFIGTSLNVHAAWLSRLRAFLHKSAPSVALTLAYFGLVSLLLSVQIWLRFQNDIPDEADTQLISGIGHFTFALVAILVMSKHLKSHGIVSWLVANLVALTYWASHVLLLTPPWFFFQGQGEQVTRLITLALVVGFVSTLITLSCLLHLRQNSKLKS